MPVHQSKRIQWLFLAFTVVLVAIGWFHLFHSGVRPAPSQHVLAGRTMGTTYSIRYFSEQPAQQTAALQRRVDEELQRINRMMSPYDPTSEISAFNRADTTQFIPVSPDFAAVMALALDMAEKTGGAFDPTVAPLVNLWGFGPDGRITEPPADDAVREAMRHCGWQRLELQGEQLRKAIPSLRLDLSALAKGYGVDLIARLLASEGLSSAVIEIGGETYAAGTRPDGSPWRIGIQKPRYHAIAGDELAGIIQLADLAAATSGDYQNFFTDSHGNIHSHILDPRTGRPVGHATAAVTVVARTCAEADALATGLYVMGPDEGLAFMARLPDAAALFILREPDGTFATRTSDAFPALAQ